MKRFTETEKWRDPWFQALPHGSKLMFLYLIDNCNNAGFYEENEREACFQLGIDEKQYAGALKGLSRGIKGASGWLWVRRFLCHQKNEPLRPENPAHKQIIRLVQEQVERFSSVPEFKTFIAPYKGLLSPIGTGIGKGRGTERKRVREKPDFDFANRLSFIFRRNGSTPWSEKEVEAFSRLYFDDDEVCMLERYYASERKKNDNICRRDLQTLLNNYGSEIDRARSWCEKNPAKSKTVRFEQPQPPKPTEEELAKQKTVRDEEMAKLREQFGAA